MFDLKKGSMSHIARSYPHPGVVGGPGDNFVHAELNLYHLSLNFSIHSIYHQTEILSDFLWWICHCDINIKQNLSQLVWLVTSHSETNTLSCEGTFRCL